MLQREARVWKRSSTEGDNISIFTLIVVSIGMLFILAGGAVFLKNSNLPLNFNTVCLDDVRFSCTPEWWLEFVSRRRIEIDNVQMDHGSYRKNHSPSWRPGH